MLSLNLLPWREERHRRRIRQLYALGIGSFCICLALIMLARTILLSRVSAVEQNILPLVNKMTLNPGIVACQNANMDREQMQKNSRAIIQSVPSHSYLTKLARQPHVWHLEGVAFNANETQLFVSNLQKTHRFNDIALKSIHKTQYIDFQITIKERIFIDE